MAHSNKEQIIQAIGNTSGRRISFEPLQNLVCSLYETYIGTTSGLPDSSQNRTLIEDFKTGTSLFLFLVITDIHPRQVHTTLTTTSPDQK